jgi:hypothetical protein
MTIVTALFDLTGLDRAVTFGRDAHGVLSAGTAGDARLGRIQHVRIVALTRWRNGIALDYNCSRFALDTIHDTAPGLSASGSAS